MRRVIDLCLDLPPGADYLRKTLMSYFCDPALPHFKEIYGPGLLAQVQCGMEETESVYLAEGKQGLERFLDTKIQGLNSEDAFFADLDRLGVAWGITSDPGGDNRKTGELIKRHPGRLKGFIFLHQRDIMPMVQELETCVLEYGLHALYLTPFRLQKPVDDKTLYPLYAKACELDIPVHFHCSISMPLSVPYHIAHPAHIDQVARDFPELRIMASVGGYPWVQEFLAMAFRHPQVYLNFETHAPSDLTTYGSGMEGYLCYGEKVLKDRLCFASNWTAVGLSLEEMIHQAEQLPFSDTMKENLFYQNALRFWREA